MPSNAETAACRALSSVLADKPVGIDLAGVDLSDLLGPLEYFIPEVFRDIYPEWRWESLDGVEVVKARVGVAGEAEIVGLAILMSDQNLAPLPFAPEGRG